jgi:exopolysaccharide biosynthesis polyprenyl glycosylphosphotransferase
MNTNRETAFLLIGDVIIFIAVLPLTLAIRYWELPSPDLFVRHLEPFAILFLVWVIVFFISGLYSRHTLIFKDNLPSKILHAQIANSFIAVLFFYLIPYFQITPKTNLFIYLVLSFGLIALWRNAAPKLLAKFHTEQAVLAANAEKSRDLVTEINNNLSRNFYFSDVINPSQGSAQQVYEKILSALKGTNVQYLVLDFTDPNTSEIATQVYWSVYPDVHILDLSDIHEEVLQRFPLSVINDEWCLRHLSVTPKKTYDHLKRVMDIVVASIIGVLSLPLYPFVALAIKLEDGGPVFIKQNRVGFNGQNISIYKFRSMTTNDSGKWLDDDGDERITKVGSFLRKSRIDEFPQLWNVLLGDLSLIGPRPDIIGLWNDLKEEIDYYQVRTFVKPGLSGWAQINQDEPPQSIATTKKRLSYDIYYVKNRSLWLEIKIALRTIATLLSRAGR